MNNGGACKWPRGKVLGGTAALNGMMYVRGNPQDYDNWAKLGNPGWSFEDVLPIFLNSENNLQIKWLDKRYHSTGGLLPVSHFPNHPEFAEAIMEGGKELGKCILQTCMNASSPSPQLLDSQVVPNDTKQFEVLYYGIDFV